MNDRPRYNPQIHHRKSIRLKDYDYAKKGLYFITICCHENACLFGEIREGKNELSAQTILNDAGKVAEEYWLNIPKHYPNVILHECIIMPNHVHGIIEIIPETKYGGELLA
jgi:putative transposase